MEVYSRSYRYIGIRYKLPYPSNGILDSYNYTIFLNDNRIKTESLMPFKRCILWKDVYCHNITNLSQSSTEYAIKVMQNLVQNSYCFN